MEKGEGGGDLNFPPKGSQSEAAEPAKTMAADFTAGKKLARQLDFNTVGGSAPAASTHAVMPDHPQQPVVAQMQQPPPPQPRQPSLTPSMQQPHAATTHQQPSPLRPVKPESPKARSRQNVEVKDGTPKKQKQCNCKHSRCLKLYCECFASGIYCNGCNCNNCHNNVENEAARRDAVETTLERNPNAFRPKIASSPHGKRDNKEEAGEVVVLAKHNKGCHCKKSGCLKKYCECFQANILCSENCKCIDCKNFEGSEERQALFHGDSTNNIAYLQQAANAAITGAIGSSGYGSPPVSRKRKTQELFFGGPTSKDPINHRLPHFQQMNNVQTCAPSSSLSTVHVANTAPIGSSKFTYRSLLADLIRPDDMKELCSVLVVYASEAARMLADEKNAMNKTTNYQPESSLASSFNERLQSHGEKAVAGESSSGPEPEKIGPNESGSERPMSPGTLALLCDEQDTVFTPSAPNGLGTSQDTDTCSRLPNGQEMTQTYADQERIVLTAFRDCLNRLITFGELKETQYSSMARSDSGGQSQREPVENNTTTNGGQSKSQQEPFSNGFPRSSNNNKETHMNIPENGDQN